MFVTLRRVTWVLMVGGVAAAAVWLVSMKDESREQSAESEVRATASVSAEHITGLSAPIVSEDRQREPTAESATYYVPAMPLRRMASTKPRAHTKASVLEELHGNIAAMEVTEDAAMREAFDVVPLTDVERVALDQYVDEYFAEKRDAHRRVEIARDLGEQLRGMRERAMAELERRERELLGDERASRVHEARQKLTRELITARDSPFQEEPEFLRDIETPEELARALRDLKD